MTYIMSYTQKGSDVYSELNDAMHLALSKDRKKFKPLKHNTGILFAEADFTDGGLAGKTKCLIDPWIFRYKDQTWGVLAIRRNRGNQPDSRKIGYIMVYQWKTPAEYVLTSFLKVSDREIRRPACRYDEEKEVYRLEWDQEEESFCGETTDFMEIKNVCKEARRISDGREENQLPRCKHSSTVLGSYVAAHSTCLSLLLPQVRKRGMRICLSLLLHIIE